MGMNTYDERWFEARAVSSIRSLGEGSWDFSDSLLLYLPQAVHEYESMQDTGTPYYELVTKPERDYLVSIASQVAAKLPDDFEFIDLGPGTEHKEQFLFDELKALGKKFTYVPVDISTHFLELAERHALGQGILTRAVQAPFEELAAMLGKPTMPRFVSLGLTFSNYTPKEVFTLLGSIAGPGGVIFVDAHMRDRVDMQKLQDVYNNDARGIAVQKFNLLDMDAAKDISDVVADEGIQVHCKIENPSLVLKEKGVKAGDTMLIFQSLRYTKEGFESEISNSFSKYELLDTNSPFIGALIWTK